MSQGLASRRERYVVDLLDRDRRFIETLTTSSNGSVSQKAGAKLPRSGKVKVSGRSDIPWRNRLIRIRLEINDGAENIPFGVYVPTAPGASVRDGYTTQDIDLHDRLIILDEDRVTRAFSTIPGTQLTGYIADLLDDIGEETYVIDESFAAPRVPMVWDAGTTKLEIIEDLCDAIGFDRPWTDGEGTIHVVKSDPPESRPVRREFIKGVDAIHLPEWDEDTDFYDIPNRVIAISDSDSKTPPLIGIYSNISADSPTSFLNTGRWLTHQEKNVAATTQSAIDKAAGRIYRELSAATETVNIDHLTLDLALGDIVRFSSGDRSIYAEIVEMKNNLEPGSLCKAKWRRVHR